MLQRGRANASATWAVLQYCTFARSADAIFFIARLRGPPGPERMYNYTYNEIRDLTATLLTEVCNDVQVEPELQEIATETMSGRLLIQRMEPD